jgi:hypothetical protein
LPLDGVPTSSGGETSHPHLCGTVDRGDEGNVRATLRAEECDPAHDHEATRKRGATICVKESLAHPAPPGRIGPAVEARLRRGAPHIGPNPITVLHQTTAGAARADVRFHEHQIAELAQERRPVLADRAALATWRADSPGPVVRFFDA